MRKTLVNQPGYCTGYKIGGIVMMCLVCGSKNTFNRRDKVLCLDCGRTWDRPKIGPSVTSLQVRVTELEKQCNQLKRQIAELKDANEGLTMLRDDIYEHNPPGPLNLQWYRQWH